MVSTKNSLKSMSIMLVETRLIYRFCDVLSFADLSRNNISTILANNFRGQDGLHELDLSFNKIQEIASWTFQHLKVLSRRFTAC